MARLITTAFRIRDRTGSWVVTLFPLDLLYHTPPFSVSVLANGSLFHSLSVRVRVSRESAMGWGGMGLWMTGGEGASVS